MKKRTIAIACSLAFIGPAPALAGGALEDLADKIEDRWSDGIEYAQEGHKWANSARTGYIGPNYSWRAPEGPNHNLIDFEPPSLQADCNGVDFHAGAFSIISGSELREQLSAMAGPQIVTHALGVALDIMSPTIAAEMKRIQNVINKWNEWAKDDCALAESLVSEESMRASSFGKTLEEKGKMVGNHVGAAADWAEGATEDITGKDLSEEEKEEAELEMNVTWKALKEAGLDGFAVFSGLDPDESMELIQSMVGTIILKYDDDSGEPINPAPNFQPTIGPKEIFNGIPEGSGTQLIKCDDDDACMEPEAEEYSDEVQSLVGVFREAIFEEGDDGGIYERFRDFDAPELSDKQRAVMRMSRGQMAQSVKMMSSDGNPPLDGAIDYWSKRLAYVALYNEITRLERIVSEALQNKKGAADIFQDEYAPRFEKIRDELAMLEEEIKKSADDIEILNEVRIASHGARGRQLISAVEQAQ
ncbi:Conjugative relaxosome accessory transposon protein [Thiohalospira halophila DSM 15071]|uniref:Conjugative relaxosome accessory transposon protein n=1 Tax=Thiohalospira halophila DSM 15071 TaxID=1123397 RepID=A0A1I1MZ31_9GAMM|nr:conjugal transfer protein TraH [Thiohalospira halophila]SFC90435.1 Conjugative relaxosome accessory transposon protein [Thiohalospira halophila DSM 15071]